MKRYSKKVREEAALICAIAASGGVHMYDEDRRSFYYGPGALVLAIAAWKATSGQVAWTRETDAEAEALIRTGWSPK